MVISLDLVSVILHLRGTIINYYTKPILDSPKIKLGIHLKLKSLFLPKKRIAREYYQLWSRIGNVLSVMIIIMWT
jgi:hypothetical protein